MEFTATDFLVLVAVIQGFCIGFIWGAAYETRKIKEMK